MTHGLAATAIASEEKLVLGAQAGGFYDSNRGLKIDEPLEISGSTQAIDAELGLKTSHSGISSSLRYVNEYLPDYVSDENDRIRAGVNGYYLLERVRIDAGIEAQLDSSLATEVQASGPPIADKKDRVSVQSTLGFSMDITERDGASVQLSANKIDYQDALSAPNTDYTYYGASLAYYHSLTTTTRLQMSIFGSELLNPNPESKNITQGYKLEVIRQFSEQSEISFAIGQRQTNYVSQFGIFEFRNESSGPVVDLNWDYEGERLKSNLHCSYGLSPNSIGNLVKTSEVNWRGYIPLSARQDVTMSVAYLEQRSELVAYDGDDLNSLVLELGHRFRLSEHTSLAASYRRVTREMVKEKDQAHSNLVNIQISVSDIMWLF